MARRHRARHETAWTSHPATAGRTEAVLTGLVILVQLMGAARKELVDGVEVAVVRVAALIGLGRVAEREAGAFWRWGAATVLPREQAAGDRVVGDDSDTFLAAEREHLTFDLAEQQVVAGLMSSNRASPSVSLRPMARTSEHARKFEQPM